MNKKRLLFLIPITVLGFFLKLSAQPLYTKMRAAFSIEAGGIAPLVAVSAETPFHYTSTGFLNGQISVGSSGNGISETPINPSLSLAITHNRILVPYRRSQCNPSPSYHRVDSYLEGGLAVSVFDPHFDTRSSSPYGNSTVHILGILGIRLHYIRPRWLYVLKIRATPFLNKNFPLWAGVGIGIGWR